MIEIHSSKTVFGSRITPPSDIKFPSDAAIHLVTRKSQLCELNQCVSILRG